MDLSSFYGLFSATCFTLVGLWWNVVERRPQWHRDPARRRWAGGIYLTFLLPALMGLFAQVAPDSPALWRSTFALLSVIGAVTTIRLIVADRGSASGPFGRQRWIAVVLYGLILALGLFPELAAPFGAAPIQVAAVLLIALVVIGHGLTWEFLTEPADADATTAR